MPGNERAVNETIDRIYEIGATVVTAKDAPIHASGHGWQEELKLMLNLTKPTLRAADPRRPQAAAAARRAGRSRSGSTRRTSSRAATGCRWRSTRAGPVSARTSTPASIFVDGVNVGDPDDVALRDRREISADGIFIVVATISSDDGSVVADPEVIFRGVAFLEEADGLVEELKDVVEDSLEDAAKAGTRELHLIQEDLHDAVGKFVYEQLRRRPMILPVVVEV